jgi:hypothetical protein
MAREYASRLACCGRSSRLERQGQRRAVALYTPELDIKQQDVFALMKLSRQPSHAHSQERATIDCNEFRDFLPCNFQSES